METLIDIQWHMACYADDIPENGGACVKLGNEQIAVFNFARRGEWYATQNLCPHKQQMVLARGMIGSAGDNCDPKVACPFHKKTFSLLTGECLSGDDYQIKTYPVKVEGGRVFIGIA
ncbi:nitrite reductase small subunit [Mucilaginibacter sp. PPCGB 2223]|uniref:nitrite reductase small subunit NirD n=1 Tax=Mucilaginibacter sp. PPCGB 2223 TaxID=1886027 RepID=UPI000825990A|nr:nitrite reductase small subunit NirD [Mucilaginibacter sp. PPCGB 2223]OCX53900.1 nitrite reductase small subunit [Mucilaginibacter sp. PPCGB 2223]